MSLHNYNQGFVVRKSFQKNVAETNLTDNELSETNMKMDMISLNQMLFNV